VSFFQVIWSDQCDTMPICPTDQCRLYLLWGTHSNP